MIVVWHILAEVWRILITIKWLKNVNYLHLETTSRPNVGVTINANIQRHLQLLEICFYYQLLLGVVNNNIDSD